MGNYSYTIKISGLSDDDIFDEVEMIINKLKRVKGLKEVGGGVTNNGSIREFTVAPSSPFFPTVSSSEVNDYSRKKPGV